MPQDNLVGVVVPVYAYMPERVDYLNLCLKSLARQEQPFVSIIVDDGSPLFNDVKPLVESYDERFRLFRRERRSTDKKTASNALNMGLSILLDNSHGILRKDESIKAICYLHSDDMLPQDSLKKRFQSMSKESPFVYGRNLLIDDYSRAFGYQGSRVGSFMHGYNFAYHTSFWETGFIRDLRNYVKHKHNQKGLFDSEISIGEDRDVTLSSLELLKIHRMNSHFISAPTYYYRIHDNCLCKEIPGQDKNADVQAVDAKHGTWRAGNYIPDNIKDVGRKLRTFVNGLSNNSGSFNADPLLVK